MNGQSAHYAKPPSKIAIYLIIHQHTCNDRFQNHFCQGLFVFTDKSFTISFMTGKYFTGKFKNFMKGNFFYLFLIMIGAFSAFLFNTKSFELFGLSYKTIPFMAAAAVIFIYLLRLRSVRISGLAIALFALLLYAFFVTFFGYYSPDGIFLLFFLFCNLVLFAALENMKFKRRQIFNAVFLISYFDALFSSFEYAMKSSGWTKMIIVPHFLYITGNSAIGGLLYQPNLNSLLLNIGLIIIAFKIIDYRGKRSGIIHLFILYLFFAINGSFGASRAGMLAVSVVFIMVMLLSHFRKIDLTQTERRRLFLMIFAYFLIIFFMHSSPVTKFAQQGLAADPSIDKRLIIWTASIMLWIKHPFFGTGVETFKFLNNPYQLGAANFLQLPSNEIGNFIWAHSEPIQILVELGAIGLIAISIIVFSYYTKMVKSERKPYRWLTASILMLFLVQASLSWPMRHPALLGIFFIILATGRRKFFFTLKGKTKILLIAGLFAIYTAGVVSILPSMINGFSYNISKPKGTDKKLEKLWRLSKDPFLFWMTSGRFLQIGTVRYLKITTGIGHLPLKKEDIKKKKMTKAEKKEAYILRKRLLFESEKAERLQKIWITEYYRGLAYLFNDNLKKAKRYAKKGISMNPNASNLWVLLHFINVKNAAIKTGRPIKDFLPSEKDIKLLGNSTKKMLKLLKKRISSDQLTDQSK